MPYNMDSDELRKLKKGDAVCVDGEYYTVTSAGYKWIRLDGLQQPINVNTAHLQTTGFGTGNTQPIFRTDTLYSIDQEQQKQRAVIVRSARKLSWAATDLSSEAIAELTQVLRKHGLLAK